LRYHLSAACPGRERLIPRRAVMFRDPREIIASWMNAPGRRADELGAVIYEVMWHYKNLADWVKADEAARSFEFAVLTADIVQLQDLCDWLEVDVRISQSSLDAVNTTPADLRKFQWGEVENELLLTIARHLGIGCFYGMNRQTITL